MTAGLTYAKTKYRGQLVGNDSGAPLDQALRLLPGDNLSNAPELVATGSDAWTPDIGSSGLTGLVYIDGRMTSDYNKIGRAACRARGCQYVLISVVAAKSKKKQKKKKS